jgi:hypothetical protein
MANENFADIMSQVTGLLKQSQLDDTKRVTDTQAVNASLGLDSSDPEANIHVIGQKLTKSVTDFAALQDKRDRDFSGANGFWAAMGAQNTQQQVRMQASNIDTLQKAMEGNQTLAMNQAKIIKGTVPDSDSTIKFLEAQARIITQNDTMQNNFFTKKLQLAQQADQAATNAEIRRAQAANAGLANAQRTALNDARLEAANAKLEAGKLALESLNALREGAKRAGINPDLITSEMSKDPRKLLTAFPDNRALAIRNLADNKYGNSPEEALAVLSAIPPSPESVTAYKSLSVVLGSKDYTKIDTNMAAAILSKEDKKFLTRPAKEQAADIDTKITNMQRAYLSNLPNTTTDPSSIYSYNIQNKINDNVELVSGNPNLVKYVSPIIMEAKVNKLNLSDQDIVTKLITTAAADNKSVPEIRNMVQSYYGNMVTKQNATHSFSKVGLPPLTKYTIGFNRNVVDVSTPANALELDLLITGELAAQQRTRQVGTARDAALKWFQPDNLNGQ